MNHETSKPTNSADLSWVHFNISEITGIVEPIPAYYLESVETKQYEASERERILLENLRLQLDNEKGPNVARSLYAVSRNILDIELMESADDYAVGILLDRTRGYSRPTSFQAESVAGTFGTYDSYGNYSVNLSSGMFRSYASQYEKRLNERGVEMKHHSDMLLLLSLHIASHESGHAILNGASSFLGVSKDTLAASEVYMEANPQEGFTGDWTTDVWIQEERFAEGAARLVTSKALEVLGYQEEETTAILNEFCRDNSYTIAEGTHQIDHIDNGLEDALAAGGTLEEAFEGQGSYGQLYRGYLGYAAPLEKIDIIEQLSQINSSIEDKNKSKFRRVDETSLDNNHQTSSWKSKVLKQQTPEIKSISQDLKSRRYEALAHTGDSKQPEIPSKKPKQLGYFVLEKLFSKTTKP